PTLFGPTILPFEEAEYEKYMLMYAEAIRKAEDKAISALEGNNFGKFSRAWKEMQESCSDYSENVSHRKRKSPLTGAYNDVFAAAKCAITGFLRPSNDPVLGEHKIESYFSHKEFTPHGRFRTALTFGLFK